MSKAITLTAALLFFSMITIGLWDLFRGANVVVALIASIFVLAGIFNIWAVFAAGN